MALNMKVRVRNLIKRADSGDPYKIAKFLGVKIKPVNLPKHVNGFWKKILKRKFIFVNEELEEWQQKAVISHELGHIVLHPRYQLFCMESRTYFSSIKYENEADLFAAMLCEDERVEKFLKEGWK